MSTVHVAIPVYHRVELVMQALGCLGISYLGGHRVNIMLVVNGADASELRGITERAERIAERGPFTSFQLKVVQENKGKAVAVNGALGSLICMNGLPDFVLSLDSDLVPLSRQWLPELIRAFERWRILLPTRPIGALAADIVGLESHFLGVDPSAIGKLSAGGYSFRIETRNRGIAGGCLLVPGKLWAEIGGYRAQKIHGDDDGPFMGSLAALGLLCPVVSNVQFFHPPDDPGYREWKLRAIAGTLAPEEAKGYVFPEKARLEVAS